MCCSAITSHFKSPKDKVQPVGPKCEPSRQIFLAWGVGQLEAPHRPPPHCQGLWPEGKSVCAGGVLTDGGHGSRLSSLDAAHDSDEKDESICHDCGDHLPRHEGRS